jgi:hypothetical protein
MENEFVTYEQALALKELGFDEECFGEWLNLKIGKYLRLNEEDSFWNTTSLSANIKAPLKQQVFRWFREKYEFLIIIRDIEIIASDKSGYRWKWVIFKLTDDIYIAEDKSILGSLTYEEAENACIDKLIELAKQQDK